MLESHSSYYEGGYSGPSSKQLAMTQELGFGQITSKKAQIAGLDKGPALPVDLYSWYHEQSAQYGDRHSHEYKPRLGTRIGS